MIDVKEIHDIPNIEKYLDCMFQFVLYEKGDEITIFDYRINSTTRIVIDYISKDELIEREHRLIHIITEDILFFSWSLVIGEDVIKNFMYRPLIDDSKKTFE